MGKQGRIEQGGWRREEGEWQREGGGERLEKGGCRMEEGPGTRGKLAVWLLLLPLWDPCLNMCRCKQGRYGVNLWGEFAERTVGLIPQLPPHTCCMQIHRTWADQSLPWPRGSSARMDLTPVPSRGACNKHSSEPPNLQATLQRSSMPLCPTATLPSLVKTPTIPFLGSIAPAWEGALPAPPAHSLLVPWSLRTCCQPAAKQPLSVCCVCFWG